MNPTENQRSLLKITKPTTNLKQTETGMGYEKGNTSGSNKS
jgi:hypothetical protein